MMNCRWTKKNLPYNIVRMYFYMLKKKEENTSFRAVIYWLSYFPPSRKIFLLLLLFFHLLQRIFILSTLTRFHARFLLQICRAWWSLCLAVSVRSALCYSSACRTGSVLRSQFIIWFFEKMKKNEKDFSIFLKVRPSAVAVRWVWSNNVSGIIAGYRNDL